ncbi:MAG: TIGR03619 family F420-dependent LLM class oxidoreductase [Anaerolineae bacterium]|nr:TIGR03619 family F420-dependent LLM class oxidoreductase [Anaerolineae bacterium]
MTNVKIMLILSENWTICPPNQLHTLVDWAVMAEACGIDAVMISEHIAMGPSAGSAGRMSNPRMYALPGNQDPETAWPSSLVLLSAIAARTSRLRLFAGAIIAPLRHPVHLAKELATLDLLSQGRLIVQPTVSWHKDEFDALGVPFHKRGDLLDEHLAAWRVLWTQTPASFQGKYYSFKDVYLEPKPYRSGGPILWFGGQELTPRVMQRLVKYGHGFHPLGPPSAEALSSLAQALRENGRDISEIEMVGGIRATFTHDDKPADFEQALHSIPPQIEKGFTTICIKPNQFIDDANEMRRFCEHAVQRFNTL